MSTLETKKRLLLTKWRTYQEAGEYGRADQLESTLTDVRYWFLEPLVHHMPMLDPRVMLRKVEEALG